MKLVYLSTARVPDDWGHVIHIMHMCSSFAHAGADVELLVPRRAATSTVDPFTYAGVEKNFTITRLPCLDLFAGTSSRWLFFLRTFSFLIAARIYLIFRSYEILYTRERFVALFFRNFAYEVHSVSHAAGWIHRRLLARACSFIVLTHAIRDSFASHGVSKDKIHVEPDAVDLAKFSGVRAIATLREQNGIATSAPLIGYAGTLKTLGMEKGVATAIESLLYIQDAALFVVGGEPKDIEEYQGLAQKKGVSDRVVFIGKVAHDLVPSYIVTFDVVVAPFPDLEHYRLYMSPLKIFEYMASGVPMIVSDLPTLREVLSDQTARFVLPGDAKALALAAQELISDPVRAKEMAERARTEVTKYTWDARAKRILSFLQ